LNIVLPIRSRVGQIETLVDHRKIRNDITFDSFDNGWPVVDGWILHLAAFDAIACACADPVISPRQPSTALIAQRPDGMG